MLTLYQLRDRYDQYGITAAPQSNAHRLALLKAISLLEVRRESVAAALLKRQIYQIRRTGDWDAETYALIAKVPLATYEELRAFAEGEEGRLTFRTIFSTLRELEVFVTFAAIEFETMSVDASTDKNFARRLAQKEIHKLVEQYIGVNQGNLVEFSYRTLGEFYRDLDLDKDPGAFAGTKRERFIAILSDSSSREQAIILRGVLERFPVDSQPWRTSEKVAEIKTWIARLEEIGGVPAPQPTLTTDTVAQALSDAETLIKASGATRGVDRVHTALHAYLRHVAETAGLTLATDPGLTEILTVLREQHPAFQARGPRAEDIRKVIRGMAAIVDALNPLRNKASAAHPNPDLLGPAEAMMVINAVRTLLHYVDAKLSEFARSQELAPSPKSTLDVA